MPVQLQSIERLSGTVVRVLGQNPGLFTLQGTNTYIVGQQNPYTLIDAGEGREEYIPILEKALREVAQPTNPGEPDISDIVITHRHHDHICGLSSVLTLLRRLWNERNTNGSTSFTPPRIHKFPLPAGVSDETIDSTIHGLPPGSFTPNSNGSPFHDLYDNEELSLSAKALDKSELSMKVIHTPGHTLDSVCLYLPQDHALFTADTILGEGTAVFEDLTTYLTSLHKMISFQRALPGETTEIKVLYPGHGPIVPEGSELIRKYVQHRLEREEQIIDVLKLPPPDPSTEDPPAWTTWTIVSTIYSSYPVALWRPATRSVTLHLRKLEDERRVRRLGGEEVDTRWELVAGLDSMNRPVWRNSLL